MSESFCKKHNERWHRNPYLLRETEAQSNNTFLLQESLVAKKGGKKEQEGG